MKILYVNQLAIKREVGGTRFCRAWKYFDYLEDGRKSIMIEGCRDILSSRYHFTIELVVEDIEPYDDLYPLVDPNREVEKIDLTTIKDLQFKKFLCALLEASHKIDPNEFYQHVGRHDKKED